MINKIEQLLELGGTKKDITFLVISGISLIVSILNIVKLPFNIAWVAIILCGVPIILEAILGLVTEFDIKADVLVSIALIASIFIGEDFAAGEVAFIMQLGALLEDLTVSKARAGIEKLVKLTPLTARVVQNGKEQIIPAKNVNIGDVLRVLPGESIPVDGVIVAGQTSVNQSVMTGESLPVDKGTGDEVSSGTVNLYGGFEMKASKVGEDSSIQRMIKLVQSADAGKAKIVGIADRWATWIVVIALSSATLTWIISGMVIRAVTILVVFCPCALVLATPTAIMAAIGNATKHGFLVKEGDALERLSLVSKIAFDKTGTLTYGNPIVTNVRSMNESYSESDIYRIAASVEQYSEHPLGKAIEKCYKNEYSEEVPVSNDFIMVAGRGVSSVIDGQKVLAGNRQMLNENGLEMSEAILNESNEFLKKGCTLIYLAIDGKIAGYIVLADTLRDESSNMIEGILKTGVKPVLLTGDNEKVARNIAGQLQIEEVYANCLPDNKLKHISNCQEKGQQVCMIGDGVNDAPALKKALVGIAMGGIGSDIAVEAADIVLIDDEVKELPHLLNLSKRMMLIIKCNLSFSMILNFIAILLAITGILNPVFGALVHNAGSVFVIINSAFLLKWKSRVN